MKERVKLSSVLTIGGAFIAWVIGSGFATGQEVLQFFSSFGYWSYGVVLINLVGFIVIGYFLLRSGFANQQEEKYDPFLYFCGKRLGKAYAILVTGTLLLLIPVLFAGAGATLNEYYGIPNLIGSAIMAVVVLSVYLIGFERMIAILSSLSPAIIIFSLGVGIITILRDYGSFPQIPSYTASLSPYQAAPHWALSGLLYVSLNFMPGSTYFSQLGKNARSQKELKYGVIVGGGALILSITVISTAILLNGSNTAGLGIPVLYLAKKIFYWLGALFSIILVGGIFSSSSLMLWSVCSRIPITGKNANRLLAVGVVICAYFVSLLPFNSLVAAFYPLIGYIGMPFIACVIIKSLKGSSSQHQTI